MEGHDGIFLTEEEYSEFVRTEIVVNAATHRDYGIKGTDIQIKMFDDRLEVDSPGAFAGMVKKENIRYTHFSRNPKIAAFLKEIYTIGLFLMLPGKKNMVQGYLWQALMSLIQEIRIMHIILMCCINLKE